MALAENTTHQDDGRLWAGDDRYWLESISPGLNAHRPGSGRGKDPYHNPDTNQPELAYRETIAPDPGSAERLHCLATWLVDRCDDAFPTAIGTARSGFELSPHIVTPGGIIIGGYATLKPNGQQVLTFHEVKELKEDEEVAPSTYVFNAWDLFDYPPEVSTRIARELTGGELRIIGRDATVLVRHAEMHNTRAAQAYARTIRSVLRAAEELEPNLLTSTADSGEPFDSLSLPSRRHPGYAVQIMRVKVADTDPAHSAAASLGKDAEVFKIRYVIEDINRSAHLQAGQPDSSLLFSYCTDPSGTNSVALHGADSGYKTSLEAYAAASNDIRESFATVATKHHTVLGRPTKNGGTSTRHPASGDDGQMA